MKQDYLSRLARAARWYLPPAEAAEVLEDYAELVDQEPEEALRQRLGSPRAAVRQLVQPKAYLRWLTAFIGMAASILLPAVTPIWQELSLCVFRLFRIYWFWEIGMNVTPLRGVFFLLGFVLALACFLRRRGGKAKTALPKAILPLLGLMVLGLAWLWFMTWLLLSESWDLMLAVFPQFEIISTFRLTLGLVNFGMGLLGFYGLVNARMRDRRWSAVYLLGLTGTLLTLSVWGLLTSMDLSISLLPNWQAPILLRLLLVTAVGLAGTAVSLC